MFVLFAIFIGKLFPGDSGREGAQAAGRMGGFIVFLILLNHLGWRKDAGFVNPKDFKPWLFILIPLIYSIIVFPFIFTGEWSLNFRDPILSLLTASNGISAGFLEEITFRGIVLYGFIRLWGNKKPGMVKGALAAFVIYSRSIWPAVTFHCMSNAVVELTRMGKSIELTSLSAVLLGLAALPLALYGMFLIKKAPLRAVVPDVP